MKTKTKLTRFYKERGIAVDNFQCQFKEECLKAVKNAELYHGSEAHLGKSYGEPFKVVVVSLDRGTGSENIDDRTRSIEALSFYSLNPHMRGTLEILQDLFFDQDYGQKIWQHYAMTNSAKCCYKNGGMSSLPEKCYKYCAEFALDELRILDPDLVVTQGNNAKIHLRQLIPIDKNQVDFLVKSCSERFSRKYSRKNLRAQITNFMDIVVIDNKEFVHLHMTHPSSKGKYWWDYREYIEPLAFSGRTLVEFKKNLGVEKPVSG